MPTRLLGILLVLLGLAVLVYPVVPYRTQETVLEVGPLEVTTERERSVPLWPFAGGVSVATGLSLLFASRR